MIWLKKNLFFTIFMVLLAGALAFEIFLVLGQRATAKAAEDDFKKKVEEFQRLANQETLPHEKNVEMTEEEIARQREERSLYVASFGEDDELAEKFAAHPTSSTNALFDIQFFVQEYRQRAAEAMGVPEADLAEEYFGFGAYAQAGPPESLLATVYKQRLIVAYILDQLFKAKPEALLSVQRPGEAGAEASLPEPRGGRGQAQAGGAGFRLDPKLSAAIPDIAETSAFQVSFTGRASTLRKFLNELASFEMPLIVRNIEVAPASAAASNFGQEPVRRRRTRTPEAEPEAQPTGREGEEEEKREENIPLVADNLSRFTVAMEFVDLLPLEGAQ